MKIRRIQLRKFRNYESLDIEINENFIVLHGDNGQGKTNILEAVYLCSAGRSHRTSKDSDLVRIGDRLYYVKVDTVREETPASIEIAYELEQKKKIRINEIPVTKLGNLMGCLNCVLFSPEDLKIVKEGPSERRRFLDIMVSQLRPSYFYDLQQYAKILEHRNNLLKEMAVKPALEDTLEVWNANLVKVGSRIMKMRKEYLERLAIKEEKNHKKLTDGLEEIKIVYSPSVEAGSAGDISEIEAAFERALKRVKRQEMSKQVTMCGPQRDDYDIMLNGNSLRLYGSQGQQRTAVLALKLSEIELMKEETGEYPVLLLDDVMSELDPKRQEFLFSNLGDMQVFITCTETDYFKSWPQAKPVYYKVENGRITNIGKTAL